MTYTGIIATINGPVKVVCNDAGIDGLPEPSLAQALRDAFRDGVYGTDTEIVSAYWAEAFSLGTTMYCGHHGAWNTQSRYSSCPACTAINNGGE